MALVLTKTVPRTVPLIKCMKGRSFAALAKKSPAIAVNTVAKSCSLFSQRVQTLACWTHNMVKQMPVTVAKKRTCCRCSAMPRSSSCSALLTKRSHFRANHLQRSRSCANFNDTSSAFIVTAANHGPNPASTKNSNYRPGHVTQQNVACSSGPGKKDNKDMGSPGDFCAVGPCNCPWPGGCPPPGFCGQQSAACNPCAIGCGCCPCPQMPQMPQMPQCNQMPGQCPCCGSCPQMAGPCGAFVPCGACGACGPCPCPPPCGPPQGGMCGTWGPCCGGGPQWGPQGVPCPFPCPCNPCGQCGQMSSADKKKK